MKFHYLPVFLNEDGVSAAHEEWFSIHLIMDIAQNQSKNTHRAVRGQGYSRKQLNQYQYQYPQPFCNVTFFDILHHYGVIAASQICSASRKYCAVLRNRFFMSDI